MASVIARNVGVDFPIFGLKSRSLKTSIINLTVGGRIGLTSNDAISIRALDNINFQFREGDRVGLVGANGSGKSTLLKLIAGIYEPTEGKICVTGKVASMLSIFSGMDPEATGYENIILRAKMLGIKSNRFKSLVQDVVEFSGLGDFLSMPIRTYSSGMAVRLGFAVSTSIESDIILMDEWLGTGDSDFSLRANARLESMIGRSGITVLASHDMNLIKGKCNRVITLSHGRISETSEFGG